MMKTKIGLLRGINVGGKNKIKMAELRETLQESGFSDVATYIQSGNLVFRSKGTDDADEGRIAAAIQSEFGLDVPVMVRGQAFLNRLFNNSPFAERTITSLGVVILASHAGKSLDVQPEVLGDDEFAIDKDVVYLYLPNGFAKTKLTNGFFEKKLSTTATSRNWKTVMKLVEMTGS